MTYDEYWNQDPWLAKDYRDAWELKQSEDNFKAWLQGLYNYNALAVIVYNCTRKKGAKAQNYPDKPYEMNEEKEKSPKEIRQKVYDRLKAFEEHWNARSETQNNR